MTEKPKLDLGVLEEDDEFEEFPVEGKFVGYVPKMICILFVLCYRLDWKGKGWARYKCLGR